jgi:D-glycero-alpha-D-manno-heptose-7-phosphate kinase
MLIECSAPTRIDLAGGTLDIYPLYLFEDGGITVNIAIDLRSTVVIRSRSDSRIAIASLDQDIQRISKNYMSLKLHDELDLISRTVAPKKGMDVFTANATPRGSGLGSSSSLLVSLCSALSRFNGKRMKKTGLVSLASELEMQNLGIPTGTQDYIAAVYGGVNAIWFDIGKREAENLAKERDFLEELEKRIILSYTGISRFSGLTNWEKIKMYIDNRGDARKGMENIKKTALKMREHLLKKDFRRIGECLEREWNNRKKLTPSVTNPKIERLMFNAKKAGALASKLCGAGGGGCMISFVKPEKRESVISSLREGGAKILPFRIDNKGVTARVSKTL